MPFRSEDQRRYLWANEPEIARDWTDTYGSRIQNNTGGITRTAFGNGLNKDYLDFKKWFDAQQQQGQEESIHNLYERYQEDKKYKKFQHMAATGGIMRLGFAKGPAGGASAGGDYGGSVNPQQEVLGGGGRTFQETYGGPYQDKIMQGGTGIKEEIKPQGLGIGKIFSALGDKIFQGRGDYATQADWQAAKDKRIGQKRIDRILNRSDEFPITEATYKNLMDAGWEGQLPAIGSTATSRGDRNTMEGIRSMDVPQNKLVDVAETGLTKQKDAIPISGKDSSYFNWFNKNQPEIQKASWQEFLQDETSAAMFDPAIHNSWQDVYQSWLNSRSI